MPELPEIETLLRQLESRFSGAVFSRIRVYNPAVTNVPPAMMEERLCGRRIKSFYRRGKFLCLETARKGQLWFHLGMAGRLVFSENTEPPSPHCHVAVEFRGRKERLYFRDPRRFGCVEYHDGVFEALPPRVRRLGPDPLEVSREHFIGCFRGRKASIKTLLLNQQLVSGIGNIYADESLFRAGIDPRRKSFRISRLQAGRLYEKIRETLAEAIRYGGSTIDDYRQLDGSFGSFQKRHRVYGRQGLACVDCGVTVRRVKLGGRGTHFCPSCQR